MPMATDEQMQKIQETLEAILMQNASLVKEVEQLKKDNQEFRCTKDEKEKRVLAKKEEWSDLEEAGFGIVEKLKLLKEDLEKEGVDDVFFSLESKMTELSQEFGEIGGITGTSTATGSGEEPAQIIEPVEPFSNTAREERMECFFGEDNNLTPVAMRRFVERYNTVKKMNMQLQITGWDNTQYRAGKIKLCLKGAAFDYVEFACKMEEEWTENDVLLLEKLQDKFIKVQAIEMSILRFEQGVQEPRETITEFLERLKRMVRDAYDGDSQQELDRKVAWRFVSGLSDRSVRDKLVDGGWMLNRQTAKELDKLQRIAEQAKRNEEASRAMSKSAGHVALFEERNFEDESDTIAAFSSNSSSGVRSKNSSYDSEGSSRGRRSKADSPELGGRMQRTSIPENNAKSDNFECYYCKTKSHRGGWFHCPKRKKENPSWRPKKIDGNKGTKDFQ